MEEERKNKQNYIVWVIPVLALTVIFGAVYLYFYSSLSLRGRRESLRATPTVKTAPVRISFSPQNVVLKKGEKKKVEIILSFQKETALDGVDLIFSFDPQLVEVSQIVPEKLFSYVAKREEELKKGKISLTFFEEKKGGIKLGGYSKILSLTLTGKRDGRGALAIVEAEKGATTVITESGTSKKILFAGQNLGITVE